jgi:hypothetical protein
LYEIVDGTLSNAFGDFIFAGRTNQGSGRSIRRALLAFDFSGLPAGAEIVSAELQLYLNQTIAGDVPFYLHCVNADWGEVSSDGSGVGAEGPGVTAGAGDATWLHRSYASSFWVRPGGDFDDCASAGAVVNGEAGYKTWRGPGMVEDVRRWIGDSSENFGWLLKTDESVAGPTAKRFVSKDSIDFLRWPRLVITYITGGPAPALATEIEGTAVVGGDFEVMVGGASAGYWYYLEGTSDLRCWLPVLSANGIPGPTGGGPLTLTAEGEMSAAKRFYRVRRMLQP